MYNVKLRDHLSNGSPFNKASTVLTSEIVLPSIDEFSLAFGNIGFDYFGWTLICFCRTILQYCQRQFEDLPQPAQVCYQLHLLLNKS